MYIESYRRRFNSVGKCSDKVSKTYYYKLVNTYMSLTTHAMRIQFYMYMNCVIHYYLRVHIYYVCIRLYTLT